MGSDVNTTATAQDVERRASYSFSMDLQVDDPQQLYDAAMERAIEDGLDEDGARTLLGSREEPQIEDCLTMLLDPGRLRGCSIDGSGTERIR